MKKQTKQKGIIQVWTSPISPALEESFKFQRKGFWAIGILLLIILGIILFIPNASAMYAGTCEQIDLSELESLDNVVYIIVGNQSNLEGLNITLNGTFADVCSAINYKPDNFTLIFWDDSPEVITNTITIYRGGGGSYTRYVDRNVTQNITTYLDRPITTYLTNDTICEEEEIIKEERRKLILIIWDWIKGLFGGRE